ncbi:MAG: hypothetical protein H0X51_07660 [Parachlamydiaceae bacterium]|nr:hypothetical protein [Parachlamydiaceae bacterium]
MIPARFPLPECLHPSPTTSLRYLHLNTPNMLPLNLHKGIFVKIRVVVCRCWLTLKTVAIVTFEIHRNIILLPIHLCKRRNYSQRSHFVKLAALIVTLFIAFAIPFGYQPPIAYSNNNSNPLTAWTPFNQNTYEFLHHTYHMRGMERALEMIHFEDKFTDEKYIQDLMAEAITHFDASAIEVIARKTSIQVRECWMLSRPSIHPFEERQMNGPLAFLAHRFTPYTSAYRTIAEKTCEVLIRHQAKTDCSVHTSNEKPHSIGWATSPFGNHTVAPYLIHCAATATSPREIAYWKWTVMDNGRQTMEDLVHDYVTDFYEDHSRRASHLNLVKCLLAVGVESPLANIKQAITWLETEIFPLLSKPSPSDNRLASPISEGRGAILKAGDPERAPNSIIQRFAHRLRHHNFRPDPFYSRAEELFPFKLLPYAKRYKVLPTYAMMLERFKELERIIETHEAHARRKLRSQFPETLSKMTPSVLAIIDSYARPTPKLSELHTLMES